MPTDMEILDAPAPVEEPSVDTSAVDDTALPVEESTETEQPQAASEFTPEPETEEFPATPNEFLTVRVLNDRLKSNPQFAQIVNSDPALRNQLYAAARLAARTSEFREVFQTPDLARTAMSLAQKYNEINGLLTDPSRAQDLLNHLAFKRGADGQPVRGQDGSFELSDTWSAAVPLVRQAIWSQAVNSNNPELAAAAQLLAQAFGDAPRAAGAAPQQGDTQPQVDPRMQHELETLRQEKQQRAEAEVQQFHQSISDGIEQTLREDIGKVITTLEAGNAALTPYLKGVLADKIFSELAELAGNDPNYKTNIQFIYSSNPRNDQGRQAVIGAARSYAKSRIADVARKHLSEISGPVLQQQSAKTTKVTAQSAKPEIRGAGGVSAPSRPDVRQLLGDKQKELGRRLSEREILDL